MELRLFVTYLTTKNHAMTPQRCFMRGPVEEELNLSKVIYIGLFTIVNLGVNKAKKREFGVRKQIRKAKK